MAAKKKEDRRTVYTKKIIRESLYELMEEKPLNKISVTQICEKADVNRSTFYSYYTDIYDLHQKIIKEFFELQHGIVKEIREILESTDDLTHLTADDYLEITYAYARTIKDNKELYKFIFNQNSTNSIHVSFGKVLYHMLYDVLSPVFPEERLEAFKISFTFVSGGTTSIIMDWIKKDCAMSTKKLSRIMANYYYGVFSTFSLGADL